jgi:hypothetical protein
MKKNRVNSISLDLIAEFDELRDAIEAAKELAPKLPVEVIQSFLKIVQRLPDLLEFTTEIAGVDIDGLPTSPTSNVRVLVRFQFAKSYRGFVAALRTRNIDTVVNYLVDHASLL